ncbi:MAG: chemotaxis protein CheX [Pseudomonadota bacterium]
MDAKIINPVIQATADILEKVGSLTIKVKKPFIKEDSRARGEITSIIALSGDLSGTVSISFPGKCILSVVSKMVGEPMIEMNDDIKDALGELTNMISGQATQLFEMTGQNLKASLSQVIMGKNHTIPHNADTVVLGVPCISEHGEIMLEMCFEEEF